ncbi:MAG: flippase-like domain-containing protein [Acidimicrobiales bacterium]
MLFLAVSVAPESMEAASSEIVQAMAEVPAGFRAFLAGTTQLLTVTVPAIMVLLTLWQRRFRELALTLAAALVAWVAAYFIRGLFDDAEPQKTIEGFEFQSWFTDSSFPSILYLAGLTAAITAASSMLSRGWRQFGWVAIGAAVVVRLLTATQSPVSLLLTVVVGSAAGSLVLVVFGAPARRPGSDEIAEAAHRTGLDISGLNVLGRVGAEGRWFSGVTSDERPVAVKYVDGDDRDADLLFRLWRSIRVKGIEDTGTAVSPSAAVSHEAMVTMLAANSGVTTPAVLGVAETDRGSILVTELPPGSTLTATPVDAIDDDLLQAVWYEVDQLHRHRIAHRQLDADHVIVTDGGVSLARLRWAVPAATDDLLAIDVADLLTATAALVGPQRAAAVARSVVGDEPVVRSLPYLQRLALSTANNKIARSDKALLAAISEEVVEQTATQDVEMAELERIGIQRIVGVFGFGVLALFVLGLIDNWSDISDVFKEANWTDVPLMVVFILLTNVAGAASLIGAVNRPMPLGDTTIVMFGQSFLNRFTPANAGGMAMRIRYLQKGGTDLTIGTAAVGLTSVASGVVQTVLLLFFVTWAGTSETGVKAETPSGRTIGIVILLFLASMVVVFAIPRLRHAVLRVARQFTTKIRDEFGPLLRRPDKLSLLFGGAFVSKMLTIFTFVLACRAFGIDEGWAQLASAYMVGTTIASAVPTPGGIGAVEAALVLTLTGLGVDQAVAWSATLLFRLISYWMPIIPGAIGLKVSQYRDLV